MNPEIKHSRGAATIGEARERARFSRDRFVTVILLENPCVRVLLATLEPGQEIPPHSASVHLMVAAADGVGEPLVGDRVSSLRAGTVAVVPAGQMRGIRARSTRFVLITAVTSPPREADHARAADARWPHERELEPGPAAMIATEHAELRPHLDHLRGLADELDASDEPQLRERLSAWRHSCAMPLLAHLRPVEFEALTAQPEHTRQ